MASQTTTYGTVGDVRREIPADDRQWMRWAILGVVLALMAVGFFVSGMRHMSIAPGRDVSRGSLIGQRSMPTAPR